jgi:hypothetical protein
MVRLWQWQPGVVEVVVTVSEVMGNQIKIIQVQAVLYQEPKVKTRAATVAGVVEVQVAKMVVLAELLVAVMTVDLVEKMALW